MSRPSGRGYARKFDLLVSRSQQDRSSHVENRRLRRHHGFAVTSRVVTNPTEPVRHVPADGPDANGGTQQAEHPAVERNVVFRSEAPGASGWEGPVNRAVRAENHALGLNWAGTVEARTRKGTSLPRKRATLNSASRIPATVGAGGCQRSCSRPIRRFSSTLRRTMRPTSSRQPRRGLYDGWQTESSKSSGC